MACSLPKVLILGHSFVKRLSRDIVSGYYQRLDGSFGLVGTAAVRLAGVGGRTVDKLRRFDLSVTSSYKPDVVILEIGTNDLFNDAPEVVGSAIEDLVHLLFGYASVRVIGWCCVIPRAVSHADSAFFHQRAIILNNYVRVVLEPIPGVFCWEHRIFNHPAKDFYLPDGVHLNSSGQYHLFRSYRGAIMKALSFL